MVKFGKFIREKASNSPIPSVFWFDYKRLKGLIRDIERAVKEGNPPTQAESHQFRIAIEAELDKLYAYSKSSSDEVLARINKISAALKVARYYDSSTILPSEEVDFSAYRVEADRILFEIRCVGDYITINRQAIVKILKKHDKLAHIPYGNLFNFHLQRKPFYDLPLNSLLCGLSEVFGLLRGDKARTEPVATSFAFTRTSMKFWVHQNDFLRVVLYIVEHLPYYVFGGDAKMPSLPGITSVYYDNDNLQMYHTRQNRIEGATLIRVRWYGEKDDKLFVERKVHHEKWVYESSNKTRFEVTEPNMDGFLRGDWDITEEIPRMRSKGANDEAIQQQVTLCNEVKAKIDEHHLKPMIRTSYNRAAFQYPGDPNIRISIDKNLVMATESRHLPGHWRSELPQAENRFEFPYAVLEVKLMVQEGLEPPEWIKNLMASKVLESIPKFSKFGHGCAELIANRCSLQPYWFHQMGTPIGSAAGDRRTDGDVLMGPGIGLHYASNSEVDEKSEGSDDYTLSISTNTKDHHHGRSPNSQGRSQGSQHTRRSGDYEEHELSSEKTPLLRAPQQPQRTGFNKFPASQDPAEATCWTYFCEGSKSGAKDSKKIKVPIRVEPKTYFANERTYLHWMNVAVMLGLMGVTLMKDSTAGTVVQIAGMTFMPLAVLFMVYSYLVFMYRVRMIGGGEALRYDDRRGPLFLLVAMLAAFSVTGFAQLQRTLEVHGSSLFTSSNSGGT